MSQLFAMVVPILPGKEAAWKSWAEELNSTYYNDFKESRKSMGVHERTFLQHTPMGDLVIVTLEGEDPQSAFAKFAETDSEFARWFKAGVKDLHNIDLSLPPQGPMPELVVDSDK
jgi:hypothetical protein